VVLEPLFIGFWKRELVETIKNPFAVGGGGAGWSVAHMLADKKVNLVIAERIGPNMETALKEKGLKSKEASGKVKDFMKE